MNEDQNVLLAVGLTRVADVLAVLSWRDPGARPQCRALVTYLEGLVMLLADGTMTVAIDPDGGDGENLPFVKADFTPPKPKPRPRPAPRRNPSG